MSHSKSTDLCDCYVPLVTPLAWNFSVCEASVARLIGLLSPQVRGLAPCLSTGEGSQLADEQWLDMLTYCVENRRGRQVVTGILRPTTREIVELALMAQSLGVNGVIVTSPYAGYSTQREIFNHYKILHDAIDIRLFVYYELDISPNRPSLDTLLDITSLPRVCGIKDSSKNGDVIKNADLFSPCGVAIYQGREENLARFGRKIGNITSLSNLESTLCWRASQTRGENLLDKEIDKYIDRFGLLSGEWYRAIKVELKRRGIINTDLAVDDERMEAYESARTLSL